MSIYQRPDSPFWWIVIEGTGRRESTGIPIQGGSPAQDRENRRQAETLYAARKTAYATGAAGLEKPKILFRLYAEWYETHVAAHRRGYVRDRSILKQLTTHFGRLLLPQVDVIAVREWMTRRMKVVKAATVNRELDVLKALMNAAVPQYLVRSPLGEIRRLRVPDQERRILTHDEEHRLLEQADDEDAAMLVIGLDALLRLSNIVFLKWPQVKFDQGLIVPLNAKVKIDYVPITDRMAVYLRALPQDGEWVFPQLHAGEGRTAPKNKAIRRFDDLCRLAQVPHGRLMNGITFHSLRHTGASRALQNGASVRTVMKLGGWKDIRSVLRYTHTADIDVRIAAESIGRPITSPSRDPQQPEKPS